MPRAKTPGVGGRSRTSSRSGSRATGRQTAQIDLNVMDHEETAMEMMSEQVFRFIFSSELSRTPRCSSWAISVTPCAAYSRSTTESKSQSLPHS